MKRPQFGEGVLVALTLALAGVLLHAGFRLALLPDPALSASIVGLGFGYQLYLLTRSRARAGHLVILSIWILGTLLVWSLFAAVWAQLLAQILLVWLTRWCCFHTAPFTVLLDLGLLLLGGLAAVWAAAHSGSLFLAVWTFFLVQALFTALPGASDRTPRDEQDSSAFECAERAAARALDRLSAND